MFVYGINLHEKVFSMLLCSLVYDRESKLVGNKTKNSNQFIFMGRIYSVPVFSCQSILRRFLIGIRTF